jgi:hypothetical protein
VITSPARGRRQPNDSALFLSGEGSDDRFRALRGRALRWYVGSRRIGSGNTAAVLGLRAGRKRIRLVACARRARCSSVATTVRLTQAKPRLTQLTHPARLGRRARRVRLRVASTVPATLRIGGRRFRLNRRPRAITLPVRPGRMPLDLRLTLSAGSARTAGRVVIARS